MRRILALAAVSSLAVIGLTGTPAAADSSIQSHGDVVVNELMVDITEGTQSNINAIELRNTTGSSVTITSWRVRSCAADGTLINDFVFPDPTTIPANGFLLLGDQNYIDSDFQTNAPSDFTLTPNGNGLDAMGGVAFMDPADPSIVTHHSVVLDSSPDNDLLTCLQASDFTPETAPSPTSTSQSPQRFTASGVSWSLATPTPKAAN